MSDQDAFLQLLAHEPSLLDPAPPVNTDVLTDPELARALERGRLDEVHMCLRCGKRAECAFVAEVGPFEEDRLRWLDLCMACTDWLLRGYVH